jgi:hypothetical protein
MARLGNSPVDCRVATTILEQITVMISVAGITRQYRPACGMLGQEQPYTVSSAMGGTRYETKGKRK